MQPEQNATKRDKIQLDAVDAKLARLLIETPAMTDQELADKLGISRQTANRRKNGPSVQKLVRTALAIPEREMRRLTTKALARLEALLDDEDPKIKLAAATALAKLSERLIGNSLNMGLW